MDADLELLGLTEYEGKVYRALLTERAATAYRLGKRSGVPLSRVYEVVARLVQKGAAAVLPGEPARYAPTPPDTLVEGARMKASRRLNTLASELAALYAGANEDSQQWLRGEELVLARAASLLAGARGEALVAAAPAAQEHLGPLVRAGGEHVHVRALALGASGHDDAGILLLIDSEQALVGRLGPAADALVTTHPTVVRLCADYFRLRTIADAAQDMVAAGRSARASASENPSGWLGWEEEKQRRLLHVH